MIALLVRRVKYISATTTDSAINPAWIESDAWRYAHFYCWMPGANIWRTRHTGTAPPHKRDVRHHREWWLINARHSANAHTMHTTLTCHTIIALSRHCHVHARLLLGVCASAVAAFSPLFVTILLFRLCAHENERNLNHPSHVLLYLYLCMDDINKWYYGMVCSCTILLWYTKSNVQCYRALKRKLRIHAQDECRKWVNDCELVIC